METKIDYAKTRNKLASDVERYEAIVNYFEENQDRIPLRDNQTHLTRLYATLYHKHKSNPNLGLRDLAHKIHNLVGGPNYLLGHWEELRKLEAKN